MSVEFNILYITHQVYTKFVDVKWLRLTENNVLFEDRHGKIHRYQLKKISNFNVTV